MKNILFLITKSEIGGAQRFVQEQLYILKKNGYKCYLITNKPGWLSKNSAETVSNFHEGIESKLSLKFLFFLFKFIKNNNITLLVCNSANGGFYGRIAAFLTCRNSVYVSHGWSSIYNGGRLEFLYNLIERGLGFIGQGVLCISQSDYNVAISKIGLSKSKLTFISNSILPMKNQSPILNEGALKIVMVCRLDHPKRPDLLIEAIKKMDERVELTIIGGGVLLEKLKKMLPLNKPNIFIHGEVAGFKDFYKFDAFALISESEGLPISALEAMSSGLALILSNVGGCPSLINGNGVLVDNNVEDIICGVNKVILNSKEYKSQSRVLFNNLFNLETTQQQYIEFYNSNIS